MQTENAMGAMIAAPDADAGGIEIGVESVEGRETAAVRQAGAMKEAAEDSFEAGGCGGGVAGVDVGI